MVRSTSSIKQYRARSLLGDEARQCRLDLLLDYQIARDLPARVGMVDWDSRTPERALLHHRGLPYRHFKSLRCVRCRP